MAKIFHYLKMIQKQEGNEACRKFYNDNLVSYGKYLQVSDVTNFTQGIIWVLSEYYSSSYALLLGAIVLIGMKYEL